MKIDESLAIIKFAANRIGISELARRANVDRRTISSLIHKPPQYIADLRRIEHDAQKEIDNG